MILTSEGQLVVETTYDGSYTVTLWGDEWLHNATASVQMGGRHHSTADNTLVLTQPPLVNEGRDKLGAWTQVICTFGPTRDKAIVELSIKSYTFQDFVIFGQVRI